MTLGITNLDTDEAFDVLERCISIEDHHIKKYAAAQALYLLGTERAHGLLSHYLRHPHYYFDHSVTYAFDWNILDEELRTGFLRDYHLGDEATDVSIRLEVSEGKRGVIIFSISIRNETANPIRLYRPDFYLGKHLLLVNESGYVVRPVRLHLAKRRKRSSDEAWPMIATGQSMTFSFEGQVRQLSKNRNDEYGKRLVLDCGSYAHIIDEPGAYYIYAKYYSFKSANSVLSGIWEGRVVSEPIRLELR